MTAGSRADRLRPDPLRVAAGSEDAAMFLAVLNASLTDGDELFRRLRAVPDDDWLRGFARALQKHLEARR
jgi:hypothetical protein